MPVIKFYKIDIRKMRLSCFSLVWLLFLFPSQGRDIKIINDKYKYLQREREREIESKQLDSNTTPGPSHPEQAVLHHRQCPRPVFPVSPDPSNNIPPPQSYNHNG